MYVVVVNQATVSVLECSRVHTCASVAMHIFLDIKWMYY